MSRLPDSLWFWEGNTLISVSMYSMHDGRWLYVPVLGMSILHVHGELWEHVCLFTHLHPNGEPRF